MEYMQLMMAGEKCRSCFNSLVDNNGEKPAEKYSNLFKSSKKVPLKSGYSKPTVVFKLEWINEVIYNSKTENMTRLYN